MYSTLIAAVDLSKMIDTGGVRVVDCRFDLGDPAAGYRAYCAGHVAGAVYADLDRDLSGPPTTDAGRHPLPPPERMIEVFGRLGIAPGDQVAIYDDAGGMIAARAWWMLHYLGHRAAAVVDGGWQAWLSAGLAIEAGERGAAPAEFRGHARRERLVTIDEIAQIRSLVDARDPRRYRGEVEPIDVRGGHIPGASNHFFKCNLDAEGLFLDPGALKQAFGTSLGTLPDSETVHYCGSGVSACHNILAQVHAGLAEPRLYCGSWSEWCADPGRPAAMET
jgi:thiosulfate/3-mercaptopyruvate sulfurtransferase